MILSKREQFHRNVFAVALGAVALLFPFTVIGVSIAVIILVLNWLVEGKFRFKFQQIRQNRLILLFTSLFLIYLIGMLHTQDTRNGIFQLEMRLSILFFPLVIGTSKHMNTRVLHRTFSVFLIACTGAALYCLIYGISEYFAGNSSAFEYNVFIKPLVFHPVYFSVYIQLCIFICVYFFVLNPPKPIKIILAVLTLFLFIFMVILAARMQLLAFVMILSAGLFYYMLKKKKLLIGIFVTVGVAVSVIGTIILSPSLRARFEPLFDAKQYEIEPGSGHTWNNVNLRIAHWTGTWEVIRENWLIGTGTGDAQTALNQKYIDNDWIGIKGYNAHNQFLQIWMRLGIIALLLLITVFWVPFIRSIRNGKLIITGFILLFAVSGLTESVLCGQKGIVFYAFFNSLMAFSLLKYDETAIKNHISHRLKVKF